jgi:zinc transport system permease protein
MLEFLRALGESTVVRNALLAGLLASIACGVVGSYVAARRITSIAGAIAHCVLGGMGAARYLNVIAGWTWLTPLHGAVAAALIAAVILGLMSLRTNQRADTSIAAVWAIGMSIGVLFVSLTPGYNADLMGYLFGSILMVPTGDLLVIVVLDVIVLTLALLFHKQLLAVCFDEEFARLRGVNVEFYYLMLLCITALTVVLLVMVVGLVMVIALLSIPVAIAGKFVRSLWQMMIASAALSGAFIFFGLSLTYDSSLPPGATTIVLAGAAYVLVLIGLRVARSLRRHAPRVGTSGDARPSDPAQ